MNSSEPVSPALASALKRARRYRIAAVVIFLAGVASAVTVYWIGSRRQQDFSDDPSMLGFNRAEERQMGQLYGKQGQLIEDFVNWLKQPGTQAMLVVIGAAIVAAGCFQFSRMLEWEAKAPEDSPPAPKPLK